MKCLVIRCCKQIFILDYSLRMFNVVEFLTRIGLNLFTREFLTPPNSFSQLSPSVGLAATVPWLDLLVSLLGAVKMSTLSLMAPALVTIIILLLLIIIIMITNMGGPRLPPWSA